jgi:LmbE family N-acetylglucosaminyl deacetylase
MGNNHKHLLVIGGHIGDAEITGGLLAAKYAAAGHRVSILHMTAGEKGNPKMDHQAYRAQRIKEADAFARTIGAAECVVLDHPDGELQVTPDTIHDMCDRIRALKPDIVLTHWRGSFHRDHRNTYEIVMEGGFLAALPGIKRKDPAHLIRGLYYLENWEDMEDYHPDLWVDVTDAMPAWTQACREHQLLRGEISFDYLHYYTGLAAKRGAEVGVKYAVTVSLPPISRKRRADWLPVDTEPVLIF